MLSTIFVFKETSFTYFVLLAFFLQGFDEDSFQLVFGKNDNIQQRLIKNVTKHPKYKEDSLDFNIALLEVDPPVVYDNEVRRIDLPCGNSAR